MTDPFITLIAEARRFLSEEAGGDERHPGFRLRALLLLNVANDEQQRVVAQVIRAAGFWVDADQVSLSDERRRVSLPRLARALGAPLPIVAHLLDEFLESEVAVELGFDHELLFPSEGPACTLH